MGKLKSRNPIAKAVKRMRTKIVPDKRKKVIEKRIKKEQLNRT